MDVERVAVRVLDVQRLDGDPLARETELRADVAIARSGGRDEEAGVGHVHRSVEMRIAGRADRLDVEPHLAGHVAHDGGEPLDQAEADRARLDREIDRLLRQIATSISNICPEEEKRASSF